MTQREKLAKELVVGDRLQLRRGSHHPVPLATVLAVVDTEQIIRKPIRVVTVQTLDGKQDQMTFSAHSRVIVET